MKYRVHNEKNVSLKPAFIFHTYFKTKREATEYAKQIGGNAIIERKVATSWVCC